MPSSVKYIPTDRQNKPIPLSFATIFLGGGPKVGPSGHGKVALVKHKDGGLDIGRSKRLYSGRMRGGYIDEVSSWM